MAVAAHYYTLQQSCTTTLLVTTTIYSIFHFHTPGKEIEIAIVFFASFIRVIAKSDDDDVGIRRPLPPAGAGSKQQREIV